MARKSVDIVVIGAGAAGLAAARELSASGYTVTILEARDRIGGRIFTVHDFNSPVPVELGAEFVHGEPKETMCVVRAARLNLERLPDTHFRSREGRLSTIPDFWKTLLTVRKGITRATQRARSDFSLAEYLARTSLEPAKRDLLLNFAEGYNAAHSEKISARSLAADEEENSTQFRLTNGYDDLMKWLRAGLHPERTDLRLSTVATELHWKTRQVEVQSICRTGSRLESFHATAAIITIPNALLRTNFLRIVPRVLEKERAPEKLEPGQVFKVVLRFREAFWQGEKYMKKHLKNQAASKPLNFVHDEGEDIPVWWTPAPSQAPVLTAWAGGPKAEALLKENANTRIDRVLRALTRVFGLSRRDVDELLEAHASHDWHADPFSRAAYTYISVGGLSASKTLAQPVSDTLFFAREAIDIGEMGT